MSAFDTILARVDHTALTAYLSFQRIREAESAMTALLNDVNATLKELAVASKAAPMAELCSASLEWLVKDVSPGAIVLVFHDGGSSDGGGRAAVMTPFGTASCLFTYESHAERKSITNRLFAAIERRTGQSVKQSPITLNPVFMFRNGSCERESWREPYQNAAFVLWQPPKPQFDPELVITHLPTPLRKSVGALRSSCCDVLGSIDDDDEIKASDLLPSIGPPIINK